MGVPVPVVGAGRLPAPRRATGLPVLASVDAGGAGRRRAVPGRSAGDADSFRAEHRGADPPVPWLPAPVSGILGIAGLIGTVLLLFGSVFAVRSRLRRRDRRQPAAAAVAGLGGHQPAGGAAAGLARALRAARQRRGGRPALVLAGVALPAALGIAVLRHRLFDIRPVLSRTLTYGVLFSAVVALYALLLLAADRLAGASAWGGLLAVWHRRGGRAPGRGTAAARIDRWVYGDRRDPAGALRRLGAAVESADPLHVVQAITGAVAEALRVDQVRVEPAGRASQRPGRDPRTAGAPRRAVRRAGRRGPAGARPVGRRPDLLGDLAGYAAVTVRAARLAEDLQASRAAGHRARGGAQAAAPGPARRDRPVAGGDPAQAGGGRAPAVGGGPRRAAHRDPRGDAGRGRRRYAGWSTTCARPRSTRSAWSARMRQRAASLSAGAVVFEVDGPRGTAASAGRRGGRRLPDRLRGDDQRGPSLRRDPVPHRARARRTLCLTITDNGAGAPDAERGRASGWTSMTERAAELGGTCTIASRGRGRAGRARRASAGSDGGDDACADRGVRDPGAGRRRPSRLPPRAGADAGRRRGVEVVGVAETGARGGRARLLAHARRRADGPADARPRRHRGDPAARPP